jgi:hypothetical protein
MDIPKFLDHHGISDNPFGAEEARHDPVFERLTTRDGRSHPELVKILGSIDRPQSSVVFGEKGSGKTALRLMMGRDIVRYNEAHADAKTLIVAYDDFNPLLDVVARNRSRGPRASRNPDRVVASFRLEDHQDAILGGAVTKLVDALLGERERPESLQLPAHAGEKLAKLPRQTRIDIAVLASLYDTPRGGGNILDRWKRLRRKLRLGFRLPFSLLKVFALALTILAVGFFLAPYAKEYFKLESAAVPDWSLPVSGTFAAIAIFLWIVHVWRRMRLWRLCRRIHRAAPAVDRTLFQLERMLKTIRSADRVFQPWPRPGGDATNARYELTRKLLDVLNCFDYTGMIVLVDRVDEPTMVAGRPERMRSLVWPMLDSKFLQQDQIGVKLLLPLELRYLVQKEDAEFFEEARLDKQNLVDQLAWSGATLYDLCCDRLRACHENDESSIALTDLFDDEVDRGLLVEALGQMRQPRDAFKLLYAVVREHCHNVPEEDAVYQIPRYTLETVRREQIQRILELRQGLAPA